MRLIVDRLDAMPALLVQHPHASVISLLAPGQSTPAVIGRPHLHLAFHDIAAPAEGLVAPSAEAVDRLLAFGLAARGPILLHCWFAISRSPAAAYILACAAGGSGEEAACAHRLRAASPECTPNPLMVALADARLGRAGRMSAAVAALMRGCEASCGRSFVLEA